MGKCDLIKLQSNFIEITLRRGCSPVNLLHIFKIPFLHLQATTSEDRYLSVTLLKDTPAQVFLFKFCKNKFSQKKPPM